jgi:hypothetical protein
MRTNNYRNSATSRGSLSAQPASNGLHRTGVLCPVESDGWPPESSGQHRLWRCALITGIDRTIRLSLKSWVERDGQMWHEGVGRRVDYTCHLVRPAFYFYFYSGFRACRVGEGRGGCKGRRGSTRILRPIQNIRISSFNWVVRWALPWPG